MANLTVMERAERSARRRELTGYLIVLLLVGAFVFFGSWASASRQRDLLDINCKNARQHADLTALTVAIAQDLGLPAADHPTFKVPAACIGR